MTVQTQKNPGVIIAVAAFAAFLATFNETFLNIGFAPIMNDLGVPVSTVQWLAAAYMLGAAVMVPVSAFAYRSIRTRPLFLFSAGLLVAGSVIGGLAPNFTVLLVGRIVQALGTGMLIPVGMNITLEVAPREKLGTYMGVMGAMTTLGPSLSVFAAGGILSFFGWHMLLWVFAGLSFLLFVCGIFLPGNIAKLTRPRLDAASVALAGIALIGILYGISTAFSGDIRFAGGSAAAGFFFLYLFISRQRKLKEPLISLKPLESKPFSAGTVINMITLVVIFAMNIVIPVFVQSALGLPAFSAAIALFPAILLSCVIAPIAGKIYDRHGAGVLLPLGFALICGFSAALAFTCTSGSLLLMALLYIPVICGSALIIGPVQSFSLSYLRHEFFPHGVTVMSTGFQVAGCIGSSLFTGVYAAVAASRVGSGVQERAAAGDAFMTAALLSAVFAFAGFVLALRAVRYRHPAPEHAGESVTLRSLMKRDIYTIRYDATLFDALKLITEKKVSGMPVTDGEGRLAGFISDGDILRYLAKSHPLFVSAYSLAAVGSGGQGFDAKLHDLMRMKVTELAHPHVITVDADDDLSEVCRTLSERKLKKAPVMENGQMIGMINASNITKYALNECGKGFEGSLPKEG